MKLLAHLAVGLIAHFGASAAIAQETFNIAAVIATSGPAERASGNNPYTPLAAGTTLG